MAQIGWGKNRHGVRDITDTGKGWRELPTAAEDTWELATEKGDKLEAKIEGGEYEDVKYKENTFTITFDIRVKKGRKKPFDDHNGVIDHEYAYFSQPEDADVPAGLLAGRCRISCELKGTDADGTTYTYTVEPLQPTDSTKKALVLGKVAITESGGTISEVACTPLEVETEPAA